MVKRKISINRKSKDWKNKYPMVEIHWVDIVSDSSWQSLKQLKVHLFGMDFRMLFSHKMERNRHNLSHKQTHHNNQQHNNNQQ